MNNKKVICFITVLILSMMLIMPCANATSNKIDISIGNLTPSQPDGIKAVSILGVVQWLGYMIGIGMIILVGIRYLLAGASEKAKAKETIFPILLGAILITMGTAITSAVFSLFGYN